MNQIKPSSSKRKKEYNNTKPTMDAKDIAIQKKMNLHRLYENM